MSYVVWSWLPGEKPTQSAPTDEYGAQQHADNLAALGYQVRVESYTVEEW